jgi:hypothetical protein
MAIDAEQENARPEMQKATNTARGFLPTGSEI